MSLAFSNLKSSLFHPITYKLVQQVCTDLWERSLTLHHSEQCCLWQKRGQDNKEQQMGFKERWNGDGMNISDSEEVNNGVNTGNNGLRTYLREMDRERLGSVNKTNDSESEETCLYFPSPPSSPFPPVFYLPSLLSFQGWPLRTYLQCRNRHSSIYGWYNCVSWVLKAIYQNLWVDEVDRQNKNGRLDHY